MPLRKHVAIRRYQHARDEDWPPYTPCACVGPCKRGSCSCIDAANYCERFCACASCKTRDCT